MVGDAAYVGERLRDVDARITWTSRLKVTSVLHELPPPRTGRSGRPRTRGARLGTPTDLAADATSGRGGARTRVRRYGRTDTVQITELVCLWYGSFRSRTVRVTLNAATDQLYSAVQHGLELVALNHVYGPEPKEGIASFQEKRPADWRKFRDGQGPEPSSK